MPLEYVLIKGMLEALNTTYLVDGLILNQLCGVSGS
jgi:hypothetical protein